MAKTSSFQQNSRWPLSEKGSAKRGFTLIELLVVIAIVGILVAIVFPIFTSVQAKADKVDSATKIRSVYVALTSFVADNQNRFPDAVNANVPGATKYPGASWDVCLIPYTGSFTDLMHVKRDRIVRTIAGLPRSFTMIPTLCNLNGTNAPLGLAGDSEANKGINVLQISRLSRLAYVMEAFHPQDCVGQGPVSVVGGPLSLELTGFYFVLGDGHVEWGPPPYDQMAFYKNYCRTN